jgi:ankyrin repeat protein
MCNSKRLAAAVWDGDEPVVATLLAAGVDVEAPPPGGYWPPLHLAIENLQPRIARLLIAAGADVNRPMGNGLTPLAHAIDAESDSACQTGRAPAEMSTEVTELLLISGAVPTEEAFEVARNSYGSRIMVSLLERYRGAPNPPP